MHLPYLYKRLKETFGDTNKFPPIVPIMIGINNRAEEKTVGRALAPWMKDEENAFIISSDFCHWGERFSYTVYSGTLQPNSLRSLNHRHAAPNGPPIHESIKAVDQSAMSAVESGSHDAFVDNLKMTQNTVCGRHPIGVTMAALEILRDEHGDQTKGQFHVIMYDRSNLVEEPSDESVSYVAAYAVP
jgi:AmmeMemoRadiSam system protein B